MIIVLQQNNTINLEILRLKKKLISTYNFTNPAPSSELFNHCCTQYISSQLNDVEWSVTYNAIVHNPSNIFARARFTGLNALRGWISPAKTGEYPSDILQFLKPRVLRKIFENVQSSRVAKNIWKCFPRATHSENCELFGTDNVRGQISEHILVPNGDYWLYRLLYLSGSLRSERNAWEGNLYSHLIRV